MAAKKKKAAPKPRGSRRKTQAEAIPETPRTPLPEERHESRPPR